MIDKQVNEQLEVLQKELSRLKKITDYINNAKEKSNNVVIALEKVQQNYAIYTDKLFSLYKQYIKDCNDNTKTQIKDAVLKFETIGNGIHTTHKEKLLEIEQLLKQYKYLSEATNNLVNKLESVDFPKRLSAIYKGIHAINTTLEDEKLSIGSEIKTLRIGLITIGIVLILLEGVSYLLK